MSEMTDTSKHEAVLREMANTLRAAAGTDAERPHHSAMLSAIDALLAERAADKAEIARLTAALAEAEQQRKESDSLLSAWCNLFELDGSLAEAITVHKASSAHLLTAAERYVAQQHRTQYSAAAQQQRSSSQQRRSTAMATYSDKRQAVVDAVTALRAMLDDITGPMVTSLLEDERTQVGGADYVVATFEYSEAADEYLAARNALPATLALVEALLPSEDIVAALTEAPNLPSGTQQRAILGALYTWAQTVKPNGEGAGDATSVG